MALNEGANLSGKHSDKVLKDQSREWFNINSGQVRVNQSVLRCWQMYCQKNLLLLAGRFFNTNTERGFKCSSAKKEKVTQSNIVNCGTTIDHSYSQAAINGC